jgi:peptide/nickel transport system permease protein
MDQPVHGSTQPAAERSRQVKQRIASLRKQYSRGRDKRLRMAEQLQGASQYQLMRAKFGKHRLAMVSLALLALFYFVAIFADFIAPYDPLQRFNKAIYAAPTALHTTDAQGQLSLPFFYTTTSEVDPLTFKYSTVQSKDAEPNHLVLFAPSKPYKLWGVFPAEVKLFGSDTGQPMFLLGADHLGRDLLSRIIHASRVSLFVGFGGVIISFLLGVTLGGISGYFGGKIDLVIQRTIELIMSVPQIPLWMALAAAIPAEWTGIQTYFAITLVLSLVGWTGLARVVRGRILSMREEDYVTAARISSASSWAIITRHLVPGFTSYLIVHITISIPYMIIGETTLSFLGIGIRPPDISWGSLLQQAQDVVVLSNYVWLLWPAFFVVTAVVLFNFIGDGLRDAADPYTK